MHKKKWLQEISGRIDLAGKKPRQKREYYLFFFSESKEEHKEFIMRNLKIMGNGKEKSLEEMSFHKKCQVYQNVESEYSVF